MRAWSTWRWRADHRRYDYSTKRSPPCGVLGRTGIHELEGAEAEAIRARLPYDMRGELSGESDAELDESADQWDGEPGERSGS